MAGVLNSLPWPINRIPLPSSPKTLRRPRVPGLDSRGEINPRETRQRCGMSSPLSSAQPQDLPSLPLLSPESSSWATGSPWGPVAGWSQGHGSPGAGMGVGCGKRSAGGLLARGTMAVSESESLSARVLFVCWKGWSRGWATT